MLDVGDQIDFDPVTISAIESDGGIVKVITPAQPCYSKTRSAGNGVNITPTYLCEIRILAGRIERARVKFPFKTKSWKIEYRGGGWRMYFLPWPFEEPGPVALSFLKNKRKVIQITGEKVDLHVVRQVGEIESYDII